MKRKETQLILLKLLIKNRYICIAGVTNKSQNSTKHQHLYEMFHQG